MKKRTESVLHDALLLDADMKYSLFKYELEEHIEYWREGMHKDKDDFVFVVTENNGNVSMVLINKHDELFINEIARNQLRTLWKKGYKHNLKILIPRMAKELDGGAISVNGVKFKE